ncbi:DUF2779 domain-containing protein [Candidatus Peregrinibacteria bacterium]|nr:DUF2779 domain-containing protein [Candidatus Peregrinibacteria bacterium]
MHSTPISKTDFTRYLKCPRYGWLCKHKPELCHEKTKRTAKQGMEVEALAHGLFAEGVEIPFGKRHLDLSAAATKTQELMAAPKVQVIYQATVHTDKYLCRADIMVRDADGKGWHLYEVKAVTKLRPEHLADISFQANVFEHVGIPVYTYSLVYLDKNYQYDEQKGLELKKMFLIKDLTKEIHEHKQEFNQQMEEAHAVLTSPKEPHPAVLKKSFNPALPPLLEEYYWKDIPDYSIYDISFITKKELIKLSEQKILLIKDIPNDFFKPGYKQLQVRLTKTHTRHIDHVKLKERLATYQYPLYFLDYETVNPAIPRFNGTRPYQKIVFQYSLHVQRTPESSLEHFEFLHTEKDNPMPHLLKQLQTEIGDHGTVFTWNQTFEKSCNTAMAKDYPQHSDFLLTVNERVSDLMKIFEEDIYADYQFKGRTTIKKILPILVPELNYENLGIQHGGHAMDAWHDLMSDQAINRQETIKNMLEYCGQDTLAMVRILEFLRKVV